MIKGRARYAAILAGVSAPIYLVIQLILGGDARPSAIRTFWFALVVFLVSLAIRWEAKTEDRTRTRAEDPTEM